MSFDVGSLVAKLDLNIEKWEKSVKAVEKDQQSLAGFALRHKEGIEKLGKAFTIAGGAMVGALGALVIKTANFGDEINDLSQRTGVATEILSGYKLAADNSGTSIEGVANGFKFLAQRMVDANAGGKDSIALFKSLGVEVTNADGSLRDSNAVMLDLADRFAGMENGANKTAKAVDVFGRSGMDLIPFLNLGKQGLKENYENAEKFGTIVSSQAAKAADEFNDSLGNLKSSLSGAGREISSAIMPAVQKLVEKATDAAVKIKDWAAEHPGLTKALATMTGVIGEALVGLGTMLIAIPKLAELFGKLGTPIGIVTTALALVTKGAVDAAAAFRDYSEAVQVEAAISGEKVSGFTRVWNSLNAAYLKVANGFDAGKLAQDAMRAGLAGLSSEAAAFAGSLKYIHPEAETLDREIKKGAASWEAYKERIRAADQAMDANKDTVGQWLIKAAEKLGLLKKITPATGDNTAAEEAAKKAAEEYASFLNSVGIYTQEQQAKAADLAAKAIADLDAKLKSGKIGQAEYKEKVAAVNAELDKYASSILLRTAIPASRDLATAVKQSANALTEGSAKTKQYNDVLDKLGAQTLEDVARATREVFRQQSLLTELYQAGEMSPAEYAAQMKKLEERLRSMGGYDIEDDASPKLNAFAQAWANMVTDIAQGWSKAFVEMFNLTEKLVGHATKHNQDYFDQAIEDLERDYEKTSEIYDQKLEEVNAYYDAIREQSRDAYDDERDALSESYDEKEKTMRREYEDRRDWIEENVKDETTRKAMLKALDREYEDNVDLLHKEEKDKLKEMEDEYDAYLADLKAQELAREKEIAAEKKAAEEKYQADLAKIRADEEKSREEHAQAELDRQNSLWSKVKSVFGQAVEGMFTSWVTTLVTPLLASITDKILPGMGKIKDTGIDAGTKAGGALKGIGDAIADLVKGILDVIEKIAKTVIDIVAYAITTLADAIATAIKSLAAAAPELLELGLVAAAIYTAFKLGESLVGAIGNIIGGGGGDLENTVAYWGDAINKSIIDYGIANGQHIIQIKDQRFGEVKDKIDNVAVSMNETREALKSKFDEWGQKIVHGLDVVAEKVALVASTIATLAGAASGAVSTRTQLMMIHGTPSQPEYIIPHTELGRFAAGLQTTEAASRAHAPGAPTAITVHIQPLLVDKGDKWMIKFIQENIDHGVLRTI